MSSPRSKLHAKLREHAEARGRKPGAPPPPPVDLTTARLRIFPQWLVEQLLRTFPSVVHNKHPFMLLFSFDMTGDPLTTDASVFVSSRLDVMLIKVNGGIYYESSTHMDGLQRRLQMAGQLRVRPEQALYIYDPTTHVANAWADITSDVSKLNYVAVQIPARFVRDKQAWDVPLDIARHLPVLKDGSGV